MTTALSPTADRAVHRVEHIMGMPITLALRGRHTDDAEARDAWAAVLACLRDADRVFSTYRPDSVISRLGRGEITLSGCPPEVAEVLDIACRAERASGGAFSARRPGPDGTVTLDPSGVVKGWAVDRAAATLRDLAGTGFCLCAGGDMTCRADDPDRPWRIGIEDPRDPRRVLATVPIVDGAVATSGTAHRGAHLVDARTGRPPVGVASVTVIARSLTCADVDATAAYALGPDAATWLGHRVGRTGFVVWADGSTTTIPPSPDSVILLRGAPGTSTTPPRPGWRRTTYAGCA